MHSATVEFEGEEYAYSVNGDYSGDIHLILPTALVTKVSTPFPHYAVVMPFEVLEEIVGRAAADRLVEFFENASGRDTLKFLSGGGDA